MRYKLDKGAHSVYALTYHYVCCVKYRRDIFDSNDIIDRLKQINHDIAEQFDVEIINQETDKDHVHVLFKGKPKLDIVKFINAMKGMSSRRLFQEFPKLTEKLWNGHLWSPSYFLCTTGQVTLDQVKKYVESQGEAAKG
jgi:REP element-mobilizing transposase RayT